MPFLITVCTAVGLWLILFVAVNPDRYSPEYWALLIGCILIGWAAGFFATLIRGRQ